MTQVDRRTANPIQPPTRKHHKTIQPASRLHAWNLCDRKLRVSRLHDSKLRERKLRVWTSRVAKLPRQSQHGLMPPGPRHPGHRHAPRRHGQKRLAWRRPVLKPSGRRQRGSRLRVRRRRSRTLRGLKRCAVVRLPSAKKRAPLPSVPQLRSARPPLRLHPQRPKRPACVPKLLRLKRPASVWPNKLRKPHKREPHRPAHQWRHPNHAIRPWYWWPTTRRPCGSRQAAC